MVLGWIYDRIQQVSARMAQRAEAYRVSEIYRLGRMLVDRFDENSEANDLDEGIAKLSEAVDLRMMMDDSAGLFDEALWQWHVALAAAIVNRQDSIGPMEDQDRVIRLLQMAVLCPAEDPLSFDFRVALATCLQSRFRREGRREDIDASIRWSQQVVDFYPDDPYTWMVLTNLAGVLTQRFDVTNDIQDLNDAVTYQRRAMHSSPLFHPDLWKVHLNLGAALAERSRVSGDVEDLEESVKCQREGIRLHPQSHPDHAKYLYAFALVLARRFEASGDLRHLDDAITKFREVLQLRPEDSMYIKAINHLGNKLATRFEFSRDVRYLNEAMQKHREALELLAQGPERILSLTGLANDLEKRFEWSEDVRCLDDVIRLRRQILELRPQGDDRAGSLHELGESLQLRHNTSRLEEDLAEAIAVHREALTLRPIGHPARALSLGYLGGALLKRYMSLSTTAYDVRTQTLDEIIDCYREALEGPPETFMFRAACLHNLALALDRRFTLHGKIEDLDESILICKEAAALLSHSHRWRCATLTSLAIAHATRFMHRHDPNDLDEWIHCINEAQALVPADHPHRCKLWGTLAEAYRHKGDLQYCFSLLEMAVTHKTSTVEDRFRTALHWAIEARNHRDNSVLRAYTHTLLLLDRFLTSRPTAELQHQLLVGEDKARSIASDACAAAIEAGQLETAIELLEQGRGMLWAKLTRYRHPLDSLRQANPKLAAEFEVASQELEALAMADSGSQSPSCAHPSDNMSYADWTVFEQSTELLRTVLRETGSKEISLPDTVSDRSRIESQLMRLHNASERWERVVEQIRGVDRFKNFLKSIPYPELQKAAIDGPVIIVNVSEYRSDALIVRDGCSPVLVPLPDASIQKLVELSSQLTNSLHSLHGPMSSGRIFGYIWSLLTGAASLTTSGHSGAPDTPDDPGRFPRRQIKDVLRSIWDCVVEPITVKLQELECKPQSRVWWYPTGPLCRIPLHAAGPHRTDEDNFCDLYISSYITTLSRVLESRSKVRSATPPSMLVIGEPGEQDQEGFLPSVEKEISIIQKLSSSRTSSLSSLRVLLGEDATPEAVKAHLPKHPWVHFTCHGFQHPQPFSSSFQLHNKAQIRLIELLQSRLDGAELAFLSACNTATGDIAGTPDEVIHLAAAMEFVGFRSVVGTLWPMRDDDGPDVTREFYTHMLRRSGGADFRDSAEALHFAVKSLREAKVPIDCWINFVHFGI